VNKATGEVFWIESKSSKSTAPGTEVVKVPLGLMVTEMAIAGLTASTHPAAASAALSFDFITNIGSGFGALVGVEEMRAGFRKQATWNSCAAAATAIAALLQAAAVWWGG
jgi:hypothetical protein